MPRPLLRDRGASMLEYVAAIALVAGIVAATLVVLSGQNQRITATVERALCQISGGECPDDSPASHTDPEALEVPAVPAALPDEDDIFLVPADRNPDSDSSWPYQNVSTTDGPSEPEATTSGRVPEEESPFYTEPAPSFQDQEAEESEADYQILGEGHDGRVAGMGCPHRPVSPFRWEKSDPMCCPGNTCETIDEIQRSVRLARLACLRPGEQWAYCRPNAADYFEHFLDGSGEDIDLDMDVFLEDLPEFQEEVERRQEEIIEEALAEAADRDIDGPITFPINTPMEGWGYPPDDIDGDSFAYDDPDWANAIGSFHYGLEGEITVYPPETPGGDPTYSLDTTVNMEKWYDWDREETDPVFSDWKRNLAGYSQADIAELHQYGMAQEFWIRGSTELPTVEG